MESYKQPKSFTTMSDRLHKQNDTVISRHESYRNTGKIIWTSTTVNGQRTASLSLR